MNVERGGFRGKAKYRYPPLSTRQIHGLFAGYEAITDRTVWPPMKNLLVVCARIHGPDTLNLMQELYLEEGADDLLLRLRDHPPRATTPPLPTEEAEAEAGIGGPDPDDFTVEEVAEAIESSTRASHNAVRLSSREAVR